MRATGAVLASRERSNTSIRVASVPSGHVYVRHLGDTRDDGSVIRLPDVARPGDEGRWWPPVMLDADWIAANHASFDVFHVHFGFDAKSPRELRAIGAALRAAGVPLVLTVHDLRNPHHPDAHLHDAQLGVLLECAAAVITLTPGAAETIAARWGRVAEVLPHPHVVDWATMSRARPAHAGFVVGLHAKSLRANMDVAAVAPVLAATVAGLPGARLRIDIHHEVFDPGARAYNPDVGRRRPRARGGQRSRRAPRARLLQRCGAVGVPERDRRIGAAVPLRHALRMAGGLLRSGHHGRRAELRVLCRAATVPDLPA